MLSKNPNCLKSFERSSYFIPTPLSFTYNNEPFVWKDSGYGDVDRIILFTTEKNIKLMLSNKEWFMDDI